MTTVGMRQGRIDDPARTDWDGAGPRPIRWTAWYPAAAGAEPAPFHAGPPGGPPLIDVGTVAWHARPDPDPGRFPVVLMSHGTGGSAISIGWAGVALARAGYAAIGVDHHGNTATEPYRPEGFLCWWERPRDLMLALDALAGTGDLAGRLDLDRVFAFGFSLGGYTVLSLAGAITDMALFRDWAQGSGLGRGPREFPDLGDQVAPLLDRSAPFRASWARQSQSCRDPRLKAAFACAPAPTVRAFRPDSVRAVTLPVGIVVGGDDREAPASAAAAWMAAHLPHCRYDLLGPTVGHYVFLGEGTAAGRAAMPDLFVDPPGVDRRAIHDATAARALQLFAESTPA